MIWRAIDDSLSHVVGVGDDEADEEIGFALEGRPRPVGGGCGGILREEVRVELEAEDGFKEEEGPGGREEGETGGRMWGRVGALMFFCFLA